MASDDRGAGGEALPAPTGEVLDPAAGLRAVARLRQQTVALELQHVEAALEAGMTWADIAACLGVSRQAAHKKFRGRVRPDAGRGRSRT
ncbi:hypothetical protein [Phycicoccus avicenniae]|uniref:hypothetical protein n=1 Tax=Phycicoccus avicenniae TaxID=2828860 RepID=UPI003D2E9640